jgi:hypothetical protein
MPGLATAQFRAQRFDQSARSQNAREGMIALGAVQFEAEFARRQCCNFEGLQKSGQPGIGGAILGSHLEQLCNELNLAPNVVPPQPPNLPLPDHVHCLIALNRSPGSVELSEALLGVDPAFDGAMVLLNGLITNDKFCFIRLSALKLEWSRRRREIAIRKAGLANNLREERTLPGGDDEAQMANSPSMQSDGGCGATVGSGLPTSPRMDSVERAGFRSPASALLSNNRSSNA